MRKNFDERNAMNEDTENDTKGISPLTYAFSAIASNEQRSVIRGFNVDLFGIFSITFKKLFDRKKDKLGE